MPKVSIMKSKLTKVIFSKQIVTFKSDGIYAPTPPPTFCKREIGIQFKAFNIYHITVIRGEPSFSQKQ